METPLWILPAPLLAGLTLGGGHKQFFSTGANVRWQNPQLHDPFPLYQTPPPPPSILARNAVTQPAHFGTARVEF